MEHNLNPNNIKYQYTYYIKEMVNDKPVVEEHKIIDGDYLTIKYFKSDAKTFHKIYIKQGFPVTELNVKL